MHNIRIIARLDIKGPNLIKGCHLEGLRVIGDPQEHARQYYKEGIDELIYIDAVASLYGRNSLHNIVKYTAENVFIPLTVGGGIRSVEDVGELLRAGADKIAVNSEAVRNPKLVTEISQRFGSQCMVLSIQAKKQGKNKWEVYTDCGREHSGKDVIEWAIEGQRFGAGEILLTSIDQDGTKKGFDIELVNIISKSVSIPVIASSGLGKPEHLVKVVKDGHADAVAIGTLLHHRLDSLQNIRKKAIENGIQVRNPVRNIGYE